MIAAGWAAINGLWFAADASKRYRAEAAWFLFAAVLIIIAIGAIARGDHEDASPVTRTRVVDVSLPAFVILAIALFYPVLPIGLLSDDFVLFARAQTGALVDTSWEFLRPLPLALWGSADDPLTLHALNIGLHGVNAGLTAILATRFGLARTPALLAGLVFLALPTSVEAVSWAAGVFDVLLATLILTACVAVTTLHGGRRVLASALLTAAALATKETAVITPGILLIASFCARDRFRHAVVSAAVAAGMVAIYLAIRTAAGFASAPPAQGASGYVLKEFLSRPFATLGLPFHQEFLESQRWIRYGFAMLWPILFAASAIRWRSDRDLAMRVLGCVLWIVVSVLPLATMLFIADDLQGSRYVYLASAAFSIMLAALTAHLNQTRQLILLAPLIALFAVAARTHQSSWIDAARERDRVLDAYRTAALNCVPASVSGLPDQVRGAYVFRNGFTEAIRQSTSSITACDLTWDGDRFIER